MNTSKLIPPPISSAQSPSIAGGETKKARLREFDALRGFSMILVVFQHVLLGLGDPECITGQIFITFRMPLFFFISGFFAYRAFEAWTGKFYKRVFAQKIKAQIICSIAFYALLYYSRGANPLGWLTHGFQAYWYTIVLFQMFTIYAFFNLISHLLKKDIAIYLMMVVALIGVGIIPTGLLGRSNIFQVLDTFGVCYYTQWFVLGLFIRWQQKSFTHLISGNYVKAILMVAFVVCIALSHSSLIPEGMMRQLFGFVISYIGLLMLVALFYSARNYFNSSNKTSDFLCFTGRRTLDIYMLHYFFIPALPLLGEWIEPSNMVLFQLLIVGGIALAITVVCLLLSNCLRSSSLLADWLFGVRLKTAQ